jgi:large subunit ribosomal protein L17
MRHRVANKHLGRTPSHRKAMRRNMAASLFEHGAIRTTEAKAKDLRRFVEKLITTARKGTLHARRRVIAELQDRWAYDREGNDTEQTIVQKLFSEIAPRYASRPGGYTRIVRLPDRRIGDAGRQVVLQLVEEQAAGAQDATGGSRRRARAEKRISAVGAVAVAEPAQAQPDNAEEAEPADDVQEDAKQEESGDEAQEQTDK